MTIEFYFKEVYGKPVQYVKDQRIAEIIQTLTGRKTISNMDKSALRQLGHEFIEVIAPREETK